LVPRPLDEGARPKSSKLRQKTSVGRFSFFLENQPVPVLDHVRTSGPFSV